MVNPNVRALFSVAGMIAACAAGVVALAQPVASLEPVSGPAAQAPPGSALPMPLPVRETEVHHLHPGDTLTIVGDDCLYPGGPGNVRIALVGPGGPHNLPTVAEADESGHWVVANTLPEDIEISRYTASPYCFETEYPDFPTIHMGEVDEIFVWPAGEEPSDRYPYWGGSPLAPTGEDHTCPTEHGDPPSCDQEGAVVTDPQEPEAAPAGAPPLVPVAVRATPRYTG